MFLASAITDCHAEAAILDYELEAAKVSDFPSWNYDFGDFS